MAIFHQLTEFCPNSCESSLRKISDGLPLPRPGDEESKCHRHSTLVEKSVEESRHSLHERQFHQNKALLSSISCVISVRTRLWQAQCIRIDFLARDRRRSNHRILPSQVRRRRIYCHTDQNVALLERVKLQGPAVNETFDNQHARFGRSRSAGKRQQASKRLSIL